MGAAYDGGMASGSRALRGLDDAAGGQRDGNRGADAGSALHLDRAAMQACELAGDVQAEAGAVAMLPYMHVALPERLEQLGNARRIDARAVVGDGDLQAGVGSRHGHL